jgi:hypothetical protein
MNDKIKAKLKTGEYILTEKRHTKSEVWKSFRELQDAGSTGNIRVRVGPNCCRAGSGKILKFRPVLASVPPVTCCTYPVTNQSQVTKIKPP